MSFAHNGNRVPEAVALASELEDLLTSVDQDVVPEIDIILIAVAMAHFACGRFDKTLAASDAILAHPHEEPTIEFAGAHTFRGLIHICEGDTEDGRRQLRDGLRHARMLPPVSYSIILSWWALLAAMGMHRSDDLVHETRQALRRAESFGDICGVITAQFCYGTVLLRAHTDSRDEAVDVLERARAGIEKHKVMNNTMASIGADLAIAAAQGGRRDEAIDGLRGLFALHLNGGFRLFVGCAGEALVRLLIERKSSDDFAEARRIVNEWKLRRPGIAAADLWWLKSRALLAKAESDRTGYAELTTQYLELCERLDARGRLDEARQMAGATTAEG